MSVETFQNGLIGFNRESTYFIVMEHGAVASTARPSPAGAVYWIGSVPPDNAILADQWFDTTP